MGPDPVACTRALEDGVYEPHWSRLPHAAGTCPELVSCRCKRRDAIGVASYWHWGTCFPFSTCNCLIFSSLKSRTNFAAWLHVVAYRVKNIHAYSFFAIYCMNSIIFLCVTLKLFSLSFVPLLAPNPGDATEGCRCRKAELQRTAICQSVSAKLSKKSTTR